MNLNFFFDNKRGGENSLTKCLLFKWHFELILLLMNLQALSFSYSTLTLFNLYVLSVLLVASFSLLKKLGSSFRAHRCRSLSFPRVCWTVLIFIGVTHVPISSSPTGVAVAACRTGLPISSGTSSLNLLRAVLIFFWTTLQGNSRKKASTKKS